MKTPNLEYDSIGDEQLMDGLLNQRPDALVTLQHRYGPLLRSVAMQVLHDETDTEEVLQDVFVQLWQHAKIYSAEKGRPLGWMVTLARRRAIDRARRRMAYRKATDRLELATRWQGPVESENRVVEREVDDADLRQFLQGIVAQLPPLQKDVIEWTFFKGMSQREIAAAEHLPLGTVKTRIELGLRKLTTMVANQRAMVD